MKVIVAHNRYQSGAPSGENRVVEAEIALLEAAGVEVIPMIEDSDRLRNSTRLLVSAAAGPVLSPHGVQRLSELIHIHRPDLLHLHNVYPLISPWSVRAAKKAEVPVVQTVHNYRHTCISGLHLRDGRVCEDCRLHSLPWPAVQHGCYRGSRGQSALMALGQAVHRPTWRLVDRFLITSPNMRDNLVAAGIEDRKIEWRPNFADDAGPPVPLPRNGPAVFVGRLEAAKGINLLLDAWTPEVAAHWGKLIIVGDGQLAPSVANRAAVDSSVEWRGPIGASAVRDAMREGRLVLMPSLCFEGFPLVAAEAMSLGRPLVLWEGMGIALISDAGAAWKLPDDPEAWSHLLLTLDDAQLQAAAGAARCFYEQHCTPGVAVQQLLRTYSELSLRRALG